MRYNGVRIIVGKIWKDKVLKAERKTDRLMYMIILKKKRQL